MRDELKESQAQVKKLLEEREEASKDGKNFRFKFEDSEKRLGAKQIEFDSL